MYDSNGAPVPSYEGYSSSEGMFPRRTQHGNSRLVFPPSLPTLRHGFALFFFVFFSSGGQLSLNRVATKNLTDLP